MFTVTSPLTHVLKLVFFPFLFLWETANSEGNPGSGSDCANPVSTTDRNRYDDIFDNHSTMSMFLFASVFGAFHFITWSFSMPTVTELWMWRSASIALTSIPLLVPLCIQAGVLFKRHFEFISGLVGALGEVLLILHPIVRLVIAVDSVVLLRSLPDTAFLVLSWSDAIPSL